MNLTNIWGAFSYLSALFVAVYIVAMKLPRKNCFRFVCFAVPAWSSSINAVLMPLFTPFRRTTP